MSTNVLSNVRFNFYAQYVILRPSERPIIDDVPAVLNFAAHRQPEFLVVSRIVIVVIVLDIVVLPSTPRCYFVLTRCRRLVPCSPDRHPHVIVVLVVESRQ